MSAVPLAYYLMMGTVVLSASVLLALLPRLTRPDVYFSVTVPASFRDSHEGRSIANRFRAWVLAEMLPALALVVLAGAQHLPALALVALALQLGALLPVFLAARRRTQAFAITPSAIREAVLAPRVERAPGGALLHAGPFVLIAAAAVAIALRWSRMPDRIPVHWGLNGQADGWIERTPGNVAVVLGSIALLCAVLAIISWGLGHRARRVRIRGRAAGAESRFRRLMQTLLLVTLYLGVVPAVLLGLLAFGIESRTPLVWIVPTLALLVLLARAAWSGQGGTRRTGEPAAEEEPGNLPVGDRTDDASWKLGLFYVNREDPVLFVEKRFGIGYTFNFGNPWSWVLLGLLFGVPLVITFALTSFR